MQHFMRHDGVHLRSQALIIYFQDKDSPLAVATQLQGFLARRAVLVKLLLTADHRIGLVHHRPGLIG